MSLIIILLIALLMATVVGLVVNLFAPSYGRIAALVTFILVVLVRLGAIR